MRHTITCKMRFNWYPFDEQICNFKIQSYDPLHKVNFFSTGHNDFLSPFYTQNALLDYNVNFTPLPEEMEQSQAGSAYESSPQSLYHWSNGGFQINLNRIWARYIFIYFIPSALCVFASWASFLIEDSSLAARCGLLVTLFLSITTILASSIISSPRVGSITALTVWIVIQYGFIILAIAEFAYILYFKRFSSVAEVEEFQRKLDTRCLMIFMIAYVLITVAYVIVCAFLSEN